MEKKQMFRVYYCPCNGVERHSEPFESYSQAVNYRDNLLSKVGIGYAFISEFNV